MTEDARGPQRPEWPTAEIVSLKPKRLDVEFIDSSGACIGMSVNVADETRWQVGDMVDMSRGHKESEVERNPVRSMSVSLRPEKIFTLRVNGRKVDGIFKQRASMSGMRSLVRVDGENHTEVVVDCPDDVTEVLGAVLGSEEELDVRVVKASPEFLHEVGKLAKGEEV